MIKRTLEEHLFGPGPKRILSLDGGGVRGVVTLSYLQKIEYILRARHCDPELCLCDYFDLIGGTSTGSIIATGLALGMSVTQLLELYRELAASVFASSATRFGLLRAKFPSQPVAVALARTFKETKLGGSELRTGLMIMTKRLDTGSPWVVHNNPKGKYYDRRPGSTATPNKDFLLRQVVRASTAAPHFFDPERIRIAEGDVKDGAFVDGGVSPHNNPSLQLLLMATLKGFALNWPLGEDKLLLVSVGTGGKDIRETADKVMGLPAAELARRSLLALMDDCDALVQTLLQWMSSSPTADQIDREIGNLQADLFGGQKWFNYLRYNLKFDAKWINENLKPAREITEAELASLDEMDKPQNVEALELFGRMGAKAQINDTQFPKAFDLPAARQTAAGEVP